MTDQKNNHGQTGIEASDVIFALFRHKWKILLCALFGLGAAAAFYRFYPRPYQSEADLLVKYVVERSAVDPVDSQTDTGGRRGDSLIAAELAILSSWDLAMQTAQSLGPERILAGEKGDRSTQAAAGVVLGGLTATAAKGSNVITVDFQSLNRDLPQPVLEELIRRYFDKHLEVHRSVQAFDFVSQQKDLVRARLNDLDAKIKVLKGQAGINSSADSDTNLQSQIVHTRQELLEAQAAQDEQSARVKFLLGSAGNSDLVNEGQNSKASTSAEVPPAILQQYQVLIEQLNFFRKADTAIQAKYTSDSVESKTSQARIEKSQSNRAKLEAQYPALIAVGAKSRFESSPSDLLNEQARLVALQAKITTLKVQLDDQLLSANKIGAVASQLQDLESQRQVEQKNYADFQSKLEKSRIDEALDPTKIPNISVLQHPSPASPVAGKTVKIAAGIAVSGLAFGLALALGLDLLLNRTIKRPLEIERKIHVPLLISVPKLSNYDKSLRCRSKEPNGSLATKNGTAKSALPWEVDHFIHPFAMAIRDRLRLFFDVTGVTHKPKLVAVTSLTRGAGTSTMAGGLAAALSEDGERKVLLVDMNAGRAKLHYFEGTPAHALTSIVVPNSEVVPTAENFYLAQAPGAVAGLQQVDTKKVYDLLPQLRASDFDYIVFDMPPLGQTSPTMPMVGFMDKVLLVVEAEKSGVDPIKRVCAQLSKYKVSVSAVFNKARSYGPAWLEDGLE